jgi:hypothetical protein
VSAALRHARRAGFTLLPVVLAMSLIAAIAFLLNRDNGVNARMIASQPDLDRARYAAEAGLQAANFVIQAAGCAGSHPISSAPVTNPNFGGAAYSAYSTTASGSPVTLVSTGSYNGASLTLTRANAYVYQPFVPATPLAEVLQPGPTDGQDTYLSIGFPNLNYGGSASLRLYSGNDQPLLKFDLSAFPAGSRVIPWYDSTNLTLQPGAFLFLWQSQVGPATSGHVNVQLVTRSWLAGTGTGGALVDGATWNTYDGVNAWPSPGMGYAPAPVASAPYTSVVNTWVGWDLNNAVVGWMSGVYPNYGIWLVDSGASIGDTYYGSSSSNLPASSGKSIVGRPLLYVIYLLPCGTAWLGATADTQVRFDQSTVNFGASTLMAASGPAGSLAESHVLVSFNVSGIPSGSTIKSALLRLYAERVDSKTTNPKSIGAYALARTWQEGNNSNGATWIKYASGASKNWTTAGGDAPGPLIATGVEEKSGLSPLPLDFSNGWVTWDLTAQVQAWVNAPTSNNGVLLKSGVTDQIWFDTRESSTSGSSATVPRLKVIYQ